MSLSSQLREFLGVLVLDLRRYCQAISSPGDEWLELCNRNETVIPNQNGPGVFCDWRWSSDLHAPTVIPFLGKRLMARAFQVYPFKLSDHSCPATFSEKPDISFIIGHRGKERLPHLLTTLMSIAGQVDVTVECIVVEQSTQPEIKDKLPTWVHYIHTKSDPADAAYNRSMTMNVGAANAKSEMLVLHDNDMVVPTCYSRHLLQLYAQGYEIINLKRYIFYLDKLSTDAFMGGDINLENKISEAIVQNLEAGGSLAVSRKSMFELGGFDESFVGWGGEDIEFWERALTRNAYRYPYLPLLHLWHAAQPGKTPAKQTDGMQRYAERSAIPAKMRIDELREKNAKYFD